ncbi:Recombination endonuclease VII [compost metagenome]
MGADIQTSTNGKSCTTCGEFKPYSQFFNSSQYKDGYGYRCKSCDTVARKKFRAKHEVREKARQRYRLVKCKYGLSKEEYDALLDKCDNCCMLCGDRPDFLCVDHCHTTNKARGLLCTKCNKGLGLLGDTKESLLKALKYLENT